MNPPNLTSLHEWIINKKAGFDILPAPEKQPFIYQKWNSAIIKRFVSYFTAAATRNSGNPFRMVRNKISLTLNYGPVRDRLKISFLMISEINPFMTETDIKSMDWFLYDIGLRHERVKNIYQNLFKFFNPNKAVLFEGIFFWGVQLPTPLYISKITNLIST